jgi:hypothetical protein
MHQNLLDQVDGRYANQQSNVRKSNRPEKSDESLMLNFEGSKQEDSLQDSRVHSVTAGVKVADLPRDMKSPNRS